MCLYVLSSLRPAIFSTDDANGHTMQCNCTLQQTDSTTGQRQKETRKKREKCVGCSFAARRRFARAYYIRVFNELLFYQSERERGREKITSTESVVVLLFLRCLLFSLHSLYASLSECVERERLEKRDCESVGQIYLA